MRAKAAVSMCVKQGLYKRKNSALNAKKTLLTNVDSFLKAKNAGRRVSPEDWGRFGKCVSEVKQDSGEVKDVRNMAEINQRVASPFARTAVTIRLRRCVFTDSEPRLRGSTEPSKLTLRAAGFTPRNLPTPASSLSSRWRPHCDASWGRRCV